MNCTSSVDVRALDKSHVGVLAEKGRCRSSEWRFTPGRQIRKIEISLQRLPQSGYCRLGYLPELDFINYHDNLLGVSFWDGVAVVFRQYSVNVHQGALQVLHVLPGAGVVGPAIEHRPKIPVHAAEGKSAERLVLWVFRPVHVWTLL